MPDSMAGKYEYMRRGISVTACGWLRAGLLVSTYRDKGAIDAQTRHEVRLALLFGCLGLPAYALAQAFLLMV
jgi:hypothetical protein